MTTQVELITVEMKGGRRFRWERIEQGGRCRWCGAPVDFVVTHKAKRMPVDPPNAAGISTSHFDTCCKVSRRV